ncbi:MAG: hypothetical protein R6X10_03205 [Desulfobacterales bacterium]
MPPGSTIFTATASGRKAPDWNPGFTALVIEHGETPFYRELAMITRLFIKEEMNSLTDFRGPEPIPVADPRNSLA